MGRKRIYETIGKRIKKLRSKNGLTQEQLARKANMSYISLVKIENDLVGSPSFQTAFKLAKALEISLDAFADGVFDPEALLDPNLETTRKRGPKGSSDAVGKNTENDITGE